MIILDWIFDRDDMSIIPLFVDNIDHRSQGSRFAGNRRSGHEDQTAGLVEEIAYGHGHSDFLELQELGWNLAEHAAEITLLAENTNSESSHFTEGEAEVGAT